MKLDLGRVLDRSGEVDVVTTDVDLTDAAFYGRHPFSAPVRVTARAENHVGIVTLDCTYAFTLSVNCDRCLAPMEIPSTRTVCHTVVRALENTEDEEGYLVTEDGIVELTELATNDILPELPTRFLCREDCRGLCPICGANRNLTDCGCAEKTEDPRLAPLRKLLEN